MPRPRPHIPLSVRVQVTIRQLFSAGKPPPLRFDGAPIATVLASNLRLLFGENAKLHLDHDPALRTRKFNPRTGRYTPDANDPEYLIYRTAEDHRRKTIIRGDHGQFSDVMLINRERRREKKKKPTKYKFNNPVTWTVRNNPVPRKAIATRRNPWPPKGSRPFRSARP